MSYPYQQGNYPPADNSYNNPYGTPARPYNVQGQPPSTPQSVTNLNRQYSTDNLVGGSNVASEAGGPLMTNTDARGFEYRHPEYGRVITQAETLIRIVPFWEVSILKREEDMEFYVGILRSSPSCGGRTFRLKRIME